MVDWRWVDDCWRGLEAVTQSFAKNTQSFTKGGPIISSNLATDLQTNFAAGRAGRFA